MSNKRVGISIRISGQAPKHLGPHGGTSWTVCAGIGFDETTKQSLHVEGCLVTINAPVEHGTVQPRSLACYRAHIQNSKGASL
jgi:hypothetical protein